MPVCAICEEVVDKVYRCAGCGVDFCKDCGDPNPEKKLCTLCMPYEAKEEEWRARKTANLNRGLKLIRSTKFARQAFIGFKFPSSQMVKFCDSKIRVGDSKTWSCARC